MFDESLGHISIAAFIINLLYDLPFARAFTKLSFNGSLIC
jgi:hypothetical protein